MKIGIASDAHCNVAALQTAIDQMASLGIKNGPSDVEELRNRAAIYAVKLLGRVTGKRPAR